MESNVENANDSGQLRIILLLRYWLTPIPVDEESPSSSSSSDDTYFQLDRSDFFNSESELEKFFDSLPDIDDIMGFESRPHESGAPHEQPLSSSPPPIVALERDILDAALSAEHLRNYIPPPKLRKTVFRPSFDGRLRGPVDNEDLRIVAANNLRIQRYADLAPG